MVANCNHIAPQQDLVRLLVTRGICEYLGRFVGLAARPTAYSLAVVEQLPAVESIEGAILVLRGQRLMLDADLAASYGVPTKRLNEQVRRNSGRFPADFKFRLTAIEWSALNRSQIATGSQRHRNPTALPLAFTEHGCLMLSNVLR